MADSGRKISWIERWSTMLGLLPRRRALPKPARDIAVLRDWHNDPYSV